MLSVHLYSPFALVDKTFPGCLFLTLVVLLGTPVDTILFMLMNILSTCMSVHHMYT